MKSAWRVISNILVWFMVIIAVGMMVFTIVSVNTFDRNDRNIFGFRCYIVLSDSMSATDFDAGDLILAKEVDPSTLQVGDIISYQSQNRENYGQTVTHKIRAKTTDANGNPGFITYGTTTGTDDESVVTYPFILGKYQMALPKVGTFFQFLRTPQGYIVCILVPFLMLIIYQGLNCVKIFRMYKAEQLAELQAEKDALENQRKQNEEMMARLMAMQQMNQQGQGMAPPQRSASQIPVPPQWTPQNRQSASYAQWAAQQRQSQPVPRQSQVPPQRVPQQNWNSASAQRMNQTQKDREAMMAEMQARRAQAAAQNRPASAARPQNTNTPYQMNLEDIIKEIGHGKGGRS